MPLNFLFSHCGCSGRLVVLSKILDHEIMRYCFCTLLVARELATERSNRIRLERLISAQIRIASTRMYSIWQCTWTPSKLCKALDKTYGRMNESRKCAHDRRERARVLIRLGARKLRSDNILYGNIDSMEGGEGCNSHRHILASPWDVAGPNGGQRHGDGLEIAK